MTERHQGGKGVVPLVGAVVWALALGLGLAFLATGESVTSGASSSSDGVVTTYESTESTTLLENEGPSVLFVLALPAVPPAVALGFRRRAVTLAMAWLLAAFCLLGIMSIGVFFLPEVALMFLAAARQRGPAQVASASRQYAA